MLSTFKGKKTKIYQMSINCSKIIQNILNNIPCLEEAIKNI